MTVRFYSNNDYPSDFYELAKSSKDIILFTSSDKKFYEDVVLSVIGIDDMVKNHKLLIRYKFGENYLNHYDNDIRKYKHKLPHHIVKTIQDVERTLLESNVKVIDPSTVYFENAVEYYCQEDNILVFTEKEQYNNIFIEHVTGRNYRTSRQ